MEPNSERGRALSAARAHLDRGFRFEKAGSLERALDAYRDALAAHPAPVEEVETRLRIARVYRGMADWERSRTESAEAIRLADEIDAQDLAAEAMNVEIGSLQSQGLYEEADSMALAAMERAQSPRVRGITLQNLGRSAAERRDFAQSDLYFAASIEAFRAANYEVGLAVALTNAAKAALDRGDAERALAVGDEAIGLDATTERSRRPAHRGSESGGSVHCAWKPRLGGIADHRGTRAFHERAKSHPPGGVPRGDGSTERAAVGRSVHCPPLL